MGRRPQRRSPEGDGVQECVSRGRTEARKRSGQGVAAAEVDTLCYTELLCGRSTKTWCGSCRCPRLAPTACVTCVSYMENDRGLAPPRNARAHQLKNGYDQPRWPTTSVTWRRKNTPSSCTCGVKPWPIAVTVGASSGMQTWPLQTVNWVVHLCNQPCFKSIGLA